MELFRFEFITFFYDFPKLRQLFYHFIYFYENHGIVRKIITICYIKIYNLK